MTDLSEAVHCDVIAALENWARWSRAWRELLPDCPVNWDIIEQMEYKNSHLTTEEKLEELRRSMPPDELAAMRVERTVVALDTPKRVAIQVHYIHMRDDERPAQESPEAYAARRARIAGRRANWYFTPQTYREAVDRAIDAIEGVL